MLVTSVGVGVGLGLLPWQSFLTMHTLASIMPTTSQGMHTVLQLASMLTVCIRVLSMHNISIQSTYYYQESRNSTVVLLPQIRSRRFHEVWGSCLYQGLGLFPRLSLEYFLFAQSKVYLLLQSNGVVHTLVVLLRSQSSTTPQSMHTSCSMHTAYSVLMCILANVIISFIMYVFLDTKETDEKQRA